MKLTPRCIDLLRLLSGARWLKTSQVHRRYFAHATLDAARKRLRKLTVGEYLAVVRESRMDEALFTLGRAGKRVLETGKIASVMLERRPPSHLEHFLAVNDVRIAAELTGGISYFFAYWELPGLGWRHSLIPDAVFCLAGRTYALEFDRGVEGIRFFIRTKMASYGQGLVGLPLAAILIITDRDARMAALAKAIGPTQGRVLFSTLAAVQSHGLASSVFHRVPGDAGVSLAPGVFSDSPHVGRGCRQKGPEAQRVGPSGT